MFFRPFVKYQGGKYRLLKHIIPLLPADINTYYEPFVGSGVVYINTPAKQYFISDINPRLINCYTQIRDNPEKLLKRLEYLNKFRLRKLNDKSAYTFLERKITSDNPCFQAAKDIFLQVLCFGARHLQKDGRGPNTRDWKKPDFNPHEKLKKRIPIYREKLKTTTVTCCDYLDIDYRPNSFVFLDPPYCGTYGYTKKTEYEFDNEKLIKLCHSFDKQNTKFLMANISSHSNLKIFKKYNILEIDIHASYSNRQNSIGQERRRKEILIRNY